MNTVRFKNFQKHNLSVNKCFYRNVRCLTVSSLSISRCYITWYRSQKSCTFLAHFVFHSNTHRSLQKSSLLPSHSLRKNMSYTPWIVELSIALHSRNSFLHYALKLTVFCAKREEKVKKRGALGEGSKKFTGRRQRKKGRLGAFPGSSSPRRRLLYRPKKGLLLHLTRPLPFNLPSPNPSEESL